MITSIIRTRLGGFIVNYYDKDPRSVEKELYFSDLNEFIAWISDFFKEDYFNGKSYKFDD